jgi:uncharacterized YigZ family protein
MSDIYHTIQTLSQGEFKDRGSKFIAYAFPATTVELCLQHLETIRKEHPKARHHCFAWRLGNDGNAYRMNDDGEPSGTAGKPILGQIDKSGVTDIIIIVVRYFGGTLLGTSGLINAYRESAADALAKAIVIEKTVVTRILIEFDYAIMSQVMNALKKLKTRVEEQTFETGGHVIVSVPKSETEFWMIKMKALIAQVTEEEAAIMENITGLLIHQMN